MILEEITQSQKWELMRNFNILAVYYNPFDANSTLVDFKSGNFKRIKFSVELSIEATLKLTAKS